MNERLSQLLGFIKDDPNDPFLLYAVALEYSNGNQTAKAREYFELLLTKHKDYLPTYYHAAYFFVEQEEYELAKEVYEHGINLARQQQETKALQELQNAYNNLLFELDDDF